MHSSIRIINIIQVCSSVEICVYLHKNWFNQWLKLEVIATECINCFGVFLYVCSFIRSFSISYPFIYSILLFLTLLCTYFSMLKLFAPSQLLRRCWCCCCWKKIVCSCFFQLMSWRSIDVTCIHTSNKHKINTQELSDLLLFSHSRIDRVC